MDLHPRFIVPYCAHNPYFIDMNKIVHFEIPVEDLEKAKQFYGSLFGWELQDWPMPDGSTYVGVRTVPVDEATQLPKEPGAINGGMMKRTAEVKAPVFAIDVESIDEKIKEVEAAGGKVIMPKKEIMGMGFYAYVTDLDGNVIGLWENLK